MKPESLLGIWIGNAHTSNGWEMKITLSILQPCKIGSTLGIFDIPFLPCSGIFRVLDIQEEIIELQAEKQQGNCQEAESETLELLSDGTLLYTSKGKNGETQAVLYRS